MDCLNFLFVHLKVTEVSGFQCNSWKVSKSHRVGGSIRDLGVFAMISVWV